MKLSFEPAFVRHCTKKLKLLPNLFHFVTTKYVLGIIKPIKTLLLLHVCDFIILFGFFRLAHLYLID